MKPNHLIICLLLITILIELTLLFLWNITQVPLNSSSTSRIHARINDFISENSFFFNDQQDKIIMKKYIAQSKRLYLNVKYLKALKLADPKSDSKSIVDRATKQPIDQVLLELDSLDAQNVNDIRKFIENNLHEPGYEIVRANLSDWMETPKFIEQITNSELKRFAFELNAIWSDLYKKFDTSKLGPNCASSHLPMKYPFIVPGGRFIEMYYWDTYWTIEGLLVCGMFDTVKQILDNLVYFIKQFGFIPNGSRVYYLNRSQPPFFPRMVMRFYELSMKSEDLSAVKKQEIENFVLNKALPCIIEEYSYWMKFKSIDFVIDEKLYVLNVYRANTDSPRPESFYEDLNTAKDLRKIADRERLFTDIVSAAE